MSADRQVPQANRRENRSTAREGNGNARQGTTTSRSLIGRWICQTTNGNLYLNFISGNQLTFNGAPARYRATRDRIIVQADGQVTQYPYAFTERGLIITFPNGVRALFVKATGQPSSPSARGNVFPQLIGKWKDIRSTGHTIIVLYGNGQYAYYSDYATGNSNSGSTNWGYGNSNEDRGTWAAQGTPGPEPSCTVPRPGNRGPSPIRFTWKTAASTGVNTISTGRCM